MDTFFRTDRVGTATIVTFQVPGLMKQAELERLSVQLSNLVEEGNHRLVLNFSGVEFISSQAIGMLVAIHKKLKSLGDGKLALCGLSPSLLQLLKITRLDKVLTVKGGLEDATIAVS